MTFTEPAFDDVVRLLSTRTGLTFAHRRDSVELGIRRAMARLRVGDAGEFLERLMADDRTLDDLVSDLTIGETYFFREPEQFERIRQEVLPEILQRRGRAHQIRAWSAACASGEEAYSLAILFCEEGLSEQAHLLATDISKNALAKARHGVYGKWSLRGTHGKAALPYLTRSGNAYRLNDTIRKRATFEPLNLALDVYPSFTNGTWGLDLILCRNVLIYFDPGTVKIVARRLFQALVDGGWLITGAADPPLWDAAPFQVVATEAGIFYRRPVAVDAGAWQVKAEGSRTPAAHPVVKESWFEPATRRVEEPAAGAASREADDLPVIRQLSPAAHSLASTLEEVRARANIDPHGAERWCAQALVRFPLDLELNYLHAILLLNVGRQADAIKALRKVIYLDRTLAVAHFTLASMLRCQGDLAGALRAYRNARDLCAARPPEDVLPLAEGEMAGRLAEAAGVELALLEEGAP